MTDRMEPPITSFGGGNEDRHNEPFDIDAMLRRAVEMVESGKSMPLSASVILPREEMVAMLQACRENLPAEIRQANWLLKERTEYLAKMQREGDEILRAARDRAERMVQRSELVREAQRTAQRTIDDANEEARRLRRQSEDYCDQKLADFETELERTWRTVQAGRDKLKGAPVVDLPKEEESLATGDQLFDQERV